MPRYFLEVSYKGTRFSGFQVQENAVTVQSAVEEAFRVLHRKGADFTGSSRTDAGVHALQNYFHFDFEEEVHPQLVYKMNAILPADIVVRSVHRMPDEAHARFDALSREYEYRIHRFKDPFIRDTSFYFPYTIDLAAMQEAAALVREQTYFFAFSKTNTQVKNFDCSILRSEWVEDGKGLHYILEGNRFLRGMVRLLTAAQLKIGRSKLSLKELETMFRGERKAGFSVPAHGLFLRSVRFPHNYFPAPEASFDAKR
jgi:tRNA pseudouridine38-40 synthase